MWKISKQFDFCYGHRVWSQELNANFATDTCLACRHCHGHQGTILISLESEVLSKGMVTDFKHLGWFKKWLDETLDHKFIMDVADPLLIHEIPVLFPGGSFDSSLLIEDKLSHCKFIKPEVYLELEQCLVEKYEGMVIVDFVPTSENLSKWLFGVAEQKMSPLNIKVSQVQFFETPKSQSTYVG